MRFISTRAHGFVDWLRGALRIAAPWLFGFDAHVWAPHLVPGPLEIGAALTSETHPYEDRVHGGVRA